MTRLFWKELACDLYLLEKESNEAEEEEDQLKMRKIKFRRKFFSQYLYSFFGKSSREVMKSIERLRWNFSERKKFRII